MTPLSREKFLRHLTRSRLATPKQIERVTESVSADADSVVLAQQFVRKGILTPFQARVLMRGRPVAFHLGLYQIQAEIGRGGMGRVYKALHRTMKRTVALKVLSSELTQSPSAIRAFRKEIEAASRLNHPNIVFAFDAGEENGRHFLVMEYIAGRDLASLVKSHGPMPVSLACEVIRQAACGLQHAHEANFIHRDIKPGNLIVEENASEAGMVVKILDFGLARIAEAHRSTESVYEDVASNQQKILGTPDYMAPEQGRDVTKADIRSDLYSLGCTFYFLLTGEVPFEGGGVLQKIMRHLHESPKNIELLRTDLPLEVAAIVRKLMAKDPGDRFQTPHELALALAPFAKPGELRWKANVDPMGGTWQSEEIHDSSKPTESVWKNLRDTRPDQPALTIPSGEIVNAFLAEAPRPSAPNFPWFWVAGLCVVTSTMGAVLGVLAWRALAG